MGTIVYDFEPNQLVYVIHTKDCGGPGQVQKATIIRVNVEVLTTLTTITYDVKLEGSTGTITLEQTDIFPDITTAMAEYQQRVQ